jgi:hypothetical protein
MKASLFVTHHLRKGNLDRRHFDMTPCDRHQPKDLEAVLDRRNKLLAVTFLKLIQDHCGGDGADAGAAHINDS